MERLTQYGMFNLDVTRTYDITNLNMPLYKVSIIPFSIFIL